MEKLSWFEREFQFGLPVGMMPFLLERLDGVIPRLQQKTSRFSDGILSNCLDGKWSVKQNIGHLIEMDEISVKRILEIKNGSELLSSAIFQLQQDYNTLSAKDLVALFIESRRRNVKTFESLNDEVLIKSSLHPRLKVLVTPVDLALFNAEHDDHHLVRINEIINALSI